MKTNRTNQKDKQFLPAFAAKLAALMLAMAMACLPIAGCGGANTTSASSSATSKATSQASSSDNSSSQSSSATSEATSQASDSASAQAQSEEPYEQITVNITVIADYKDQTLDYQTQLGLNSGSTALDALQGTGLDVVVEDGPYGAFVSSINGIANEGSNGWTYTINGEMPTVSADESVLTMDDVVEWSYFVS